MQSKVIGSFGVKAFNCPVRNDSRGFFVKNFGDFCDDVIADPIKECFLSQSHKGVVRGMHFQKPPFDHAKLVNVVMGKVLDVVVDLRKGATYGEFVSVELDPSSYNVLFIPKGCAHGFLSLEDNTLMSYLTTSNYSPDHDHGLHYDSFGFKWPEESPLVSDRDSELPVFKDLEEYQWSS